MSKYKVEGFVDKINEKNGNSSRGPWTAYSVKIQDAKTGDVNPLWFQFGFDKPGFAEGDYITFEAEPKNDKAAQFIEGSGKKPKNPPAKPAKPETKGKGGGYAKAKVTKSDLFGDIGGYNTEDDIRRMSFSAARAAAVQVVEALLAHDGLPMSVSKAKAGQAKRYEQIIAMIDKLTVRYFFDAATGRILEDTDDEGNVGKREQPLPEDADEAPEEEAEEEEEEEEATDDESF